MGWDGEAAVVVGVAVERRFDVEVWPEVPVLVVELPESDWRLFLLEPFLDPLVDRTAWT